MDFTGLQPFQHLPAPNRSGNRNCQDEASNLTNAAAIAEVETVCGAEPA